jgi:hypothetical protein
MANNKPINRLIKDKKILQYPLGLGSHEVDAYDNATQYMFFKITSTSKASTLRDDAKKGDVYVTDSRTGIGTATETTSKVAVGPLALKDNAKDADPDLRLMYSNDAVDKQFFRQQKGMSRLDKVVILPMPNMHSVGTTVQYNQNFSPTLLTKAGDMYNQLGNGVGTELATLLKNVAITGGVSKLSSALGIRGQDADAVQAALLAEERLAINPKKEVMFDSFGYRQFSFQFNFAPKSKEESDMVAAIIETFRYYALPEISPAKNFYLLPAEFNINFMLGKENNPHIPKIMTSVLQRVSVNYSPNSGVWATLPNGAPLAIDMTLEFLELSLVDRNRVWNSASPITSGY